MSKIGVGVGEDFPVDDAPGPNSAHRREGGHHGGGHHGGGHGCGFDYGEYRWRRHEWREQRREWKRKWKAYARERRAWDREYGAGPRPHAFFGLRFGLPFVLIPLIGIAMIVAFFTALFRFPFMLLALLVGGFLYATHRRHRHHHHFHPAGGRHADQYHRDDAPDDVPDDAQMRDVTPPRDAQTPPPANPPANPPTNPSTNPQD